MLVAYAIVGYPVVGAAVGHVYPAVPVLGLAPCPTTLLTGGARTPTTTNTMTATRTITTATQADNRVADLHVWRVGRGTSRRSSPW